MSRIESIRKSLGEGQAALVITPANRRYFTGFASTLGYLFISCWHSVLYVDSRYFEAAGKSVSGCEVRQLVKLETALSDFAAQNGVREYLTEKEISVGEFARLKELSPLSFSAEGLSALVEALRQRKTEQEIAHIRAAQIIAEKAFAELIPLIRPGVPERDLALELEYKMRRLGAEDTSFDTIVVSGENSSLPHGTPGERQVQPGDLITFDFGAVVHGYHSDMTRTLGVGHVSEEMRRVYGIVLEAQETCINHLIAGLSCEEGDRASRSVIEAAGYGEYFGHGTGHSVGLDIHEPPRLSPLCDDILQPGMVLTVEPGIYLPGKFGVRIEDMVVVTETGCENLTQFPKELMILDC